MARNYSSNALDTTLSASVTSVATTMVVTSLTGFPIAPFIASVITSEASQELVLVTAVNGTTLTVTRGFDGTEAQAHAAGVVFRHAHAAVDFRDSANHIDASVAHGASGAVVGTTNVQTLTNKTLTSPVINGTPSGIGSIQFARKLGSQSVVNSVAPVNDNHLFFTAEANAVYDVRIVLQVQNGGGIRMRLTGPTSATAYTMGSIPHANENFSASSFTEVLIYDEAPNNDYCEFVHATVQYPSGGTVTFRWAQDIAGATATSLGSGCYLVATRVA